MTRKSDYLQKIAAQIAADAKERYARWDDEAFDAYLGWQTNFIWEALSKESARIRERSIRIYLELVVAGIGGGYLTAGYRGARTLTEAFIRDCIPQWFTRSSPDAHAKVATTAWNIAEGARNQAIWLDQYLLARLYDFDDPLMLEQKAVELLKPVIEPPVRAKWAGPFTVTVLDLSEEASGFLPGDMAVVAPSLIRVADRRSGERVAVGVLLLPGGKSEVIGRMDDTPDVPDMLPAVDVALTWSADNVAVGSAVVDLPLMACKPLHTLALPSGFLVAAVQNSQRLWLVETP